MPKYDMVVETNGETTSQGVIFQWTPANSRILDAGCACGYMGTALKNNKNCRCTGIEYFAESRADAIATGSYDQVLDIDLNNITAEKLTAVGTGFDRIIFCDVLEHLLEPAKVLQQIQSLLNPENPDAGFLISLPNVAHASVKAGLLLDEFEYTPYGLLDATHLRFFTWKNVAKTMTEAGMEIRKGQGTLLDIGGFFGQPAFNKLDSNTKFCIFRDVHSYICQYIVYAVPSALAKDKLLKLNLEKLNFSFESFPPILKQYAQQQMQQCSFSV